MNENNSISPDVGRLSDIPDQALRGMHYTMVKIRRLEESISKLIEAGEIKCPCHLYIGQEAVATGACMPLRKNDWVFSTHRSHGHYLAKGGNINSLMAELYGKSTGCSRGMGGSMHLSSPNLGLPGSSAIVGGSIPLAVGAALASSIKKRDDVSMVFFGDGAVCEGVFYEALNFAALKRLPVIFVCENNNYSTHMPISSCLADTDIYKKAQVFKIPGIRIDGNCVTDVCRASAKAIDNARRGGGPTLIECITYRLCGHVGPRDDLDKGLRSKEEMDYWQNRCPIKMLEDSLLNSGLISESDIMQINEKVGREIDNAIAFARQSPYPREDRLSPVFKGCT